MSTPMPIELILAAHNYECPCIMSLQFGCNYMAAYLVEFRHVDGTEHCDAQARKLPLCPEHTKAATVAAGGGPLADILGAQPPPPCPCGKPINIHGVTTLRGEPV
jgi:hypothetical protein